MVKSFQTAQPKAKQQPETPEGNQEAPQNKAIQNAPANKGGKPKAVNNAPEDEGNAPENESPSDKFKRLANQRTNKALKYIDMLKNLASRQYEYTDEQVAIILGALRGEVDELEAAFKKAAKVRPTIDLLSGIGGQN